MRKILETVLCILAIAVGIVVFLQLDVESILLQRADFTTASQQEIENNPTKDYAGLPGGEDITELENIEQWEDIISDSDFVTVTPRSIVKTDVATLAGWESFFNSRSNGTTGRRRSEVKKGGLDLFSLYCPIYVIEMQDGNYVYAQMNRYYARKIEKGEEVTLPLGTRKGMLENTRTLLKEGYAEYKAPEDYLLYTINDEWQEENADTIFFARSGIAAAVAIVLAVILLCVVPTKSKADTE